jgi:hypothetical protein
MKIKYACLLKKLQLTGTTKNGAFMECNFLEKSPEEFVELFYSDCFPQ